jgi:multimeric flavodoxin WrbA
MKVLVIMGSPRKGNTYRAAERILEILQETTPVEWEYVMLGEISLSPCRGCNTCFDRGEESCPLNDDASGLEQKMLAADGVIFASPVYAMQVSGLMKTFIDRHSYIFHRPRFFRQKALILTTAGVMGINEVLDYLEQVARIWGFEVAARVGIITLEGMGPSSRVQENERKLMEAAAAFSAALRRGSRSSPGLSDVIIFHGMRAIFDELADLFPADHRYWTRKGWLDPGQRYYVDVPVNPLYHLIGVIAEWYSRRQVRNDLP